MPILISVHCRKIKESKESHHHFEKVSADYDAALLRNSQASKSRPQEMEEVDNILSASKACFRHKALEHVFCLKKLNASKTPELFSTVSIITILVHVLLLSD